MEIEYNKKYYTLPDELLTKNNSYELVEQLGSGGNGVVCECIDRAGDAYAVKFLMHINSVAIARFEQEIALLKQFDNPHIIKYIDDGIVIIEEGCTKSSSQKEIPFFIMEKADKNLLALLKENESIPYNSYIAQFRGLCQGLKELHARAIHRDIKPENILIKGERWILADFGLCALLDTAQRKDLTREYAKIGPQFWISPEAVNKFYFGDKACSRIDTYSDIFQLCSVFVFALNREYPSGILTESEIKCPVEKLCELLIRALSHDPKKRPKDGQELFNAFNSIIPA